MRWRQAVLPALAMAMSPMPAAAQPFVSKAEAARAAKGSEIVCKTQPKPGSRIQIRSCLTRWQWDQVSLLQQRDLKEVADRPLHQEPQRLAAQTIDR